MSPTRKQGSSLLARLRVGLNSSNRQLILLDRLWLVDAILQDEVEPGFADLLRVAALAASEARLLGGHLLFAVLGQQHGNKMRCVRNAQFPSQTFDRLGALVVPLDRVFVRTK